ncbi:hypothetical protein GMA3_65 [Gordonia phage GMA3]|uniref:Uncharacterized protein n=1 Tax=Gordonia phage GMA3 TaxID=1647284 RepID=A0A0K0NL14_9CAUD|nr:hypothetical protein AU105_gp065 [Gordonia phage GMA3]AKL88242.1 hypothetical protein GMA3_65 [Gordonia phage GMA3]
MGLNFNGNFKPNNAEPGAKSINGYERIYIDHKHGKLLSSFGDNTKFQGLLNGSGVVEAVPLGLVRQRQMWPSGDEGGTMAGKIAKGGKQCISLDGNVGHPQANFPYQEFRDRLTSPIASKPTIRCHECPFTKWSQDGKTGPPCQPRWYVPMLPLIDNMIAWEEKPAILDMTQSGITVFKNFYLNDIRTGNYLFKYVWSIHTERVMKNGVTFSKPKFYANNTTPKYMYPMFVYWMRRITAEFTDPARLPRMGGSSSTITALKPSITGVKSNAITALRPRT